MPKIIERIASLIKEKEMSTRAFEIGIGASNGMIGRAILKGTDISAEWLSEIIDTHRDVNAHWLLTGEGEIFKTKSTEKFTYSKGEKEGELKGEKRKVQKSSPIDEVKVITLDTSGTEVMPIVDISAAAGAGAYNPDYVETLDTIRLPSRMLHRGPHNCIRIAGDSMAPTM